MKANHRLGICTSACMGMLLLAGGFVACTTQEASNNGTGGTTATGGTTSASGGTTPTGGATGGTTAPTDSPEALGTLCPLPAGALISDFTYTPTDAGTAPQVRFGAVPGFCGGSFIYPTTGSYPIANDLTANSWHITGSIGDYSGFGLYFDSCTGACNKLDLSAYKGIQFKISGTMPAGTSITMGIDTLKNTITSTWLNAHGGDGTVKPGVCTPTGGTNQWDQTTCSNFKKAVTIDPAQPTVAFKWSDFTGGKPAMAIDPKEILAIYWSFSAPAGVGTAAVTTYKVDITLDDLELIP